MNELEGLRLTERLQADLADGQVASQVGELGGKRRIELQPFTAHRQEQQHAAALPDPVVSQVAQQVEGGPIHPLQVIEEQHQWRALG